MIDRRFTEISSWKRMRIDRPDHHGEDRAGRAGEARADDVGAQLDRDEVDAEGLRHVLVLADRHPGPPHLRGLQAGGDEGGNAGETEGQAVEGDRRADAPRRRASGGRCR